MEHIIQFAVSVDDDRITELAEETAEKKLVEDFKKAEAEGRYGFRDGWTSGVKNAVIDALIAEFKYEGRDMSLIVEKVADRLARSPKFRDTVAEALAEKVLEQ